MLMNFTILLQILFQHRNRLLQILLLIFIFMLDFAVHFSLNHTVRYECIFEVSYSFLQLLFVLNKLSCLIQLVFKRLNLILLIGYSISLRRDFALKWLLIFEQSCYKLRQSSIETVEILQLFVHFVCLSLHFGDLLLSGSNVLLQFLDLMIQDIFKLFQLLSLFLQFINFSFVSVNRFVSILDDQGLTLDFLFKLLVGLL